MNYQETVASLLNDCATKLSADDYGQLQDLLTALGYNPDDVSGEDDEESSLTPEQANKVIDLLKDKLNIDDMTGAINKLGQITSSSSLTGRDDPLPFPSMPKPGGTMSGAQDAARKAWRKMAMDRVLGRSKPQAADSFATRFPQAMKIQHDVAATITRKGKPAHPSSSDAFFERFPDARKVQI
jgi:hypothetical protein